MPGACCRSKKHTPIVSEKQRRFFGAEYGRAKRGEPRNTEMTLAVMKRHLKEAGGKKLPKKKKSSREKYKDLLKGR